MRRFLIIALFMSVYMSNAQDYNYESIIARVPEAYEDYGLVYYEAKDHYTFSYGGKKQILTSRKDVERIIVPKLTGSPVHYDYTNSKSLIRNAAAQLYVPEKSRFMPAEVFERVEAVENNGHFVDDFFVNRFSLSPRGYRAEDAKRIYKLNYTMIVDDYKFNSRVWLIPHSGTMNSEVILDIPNELDVEFLEMNFESFDIQKSQTSHENFTRYTYRMDDIPGIEDCQNCPSGSFFMPHIIIIYKSYTNRTGKKQRLMPEASDLYDWYSSLVKDIEEKPDEIQELVQRFKEMPRGKEQIYAVNDYIKRNIRYIAYEDGIAGFQPDACQKVYANKYGDCKGMANLCKNTLIQLGYDARLSWIGTRSKIPYDYSIPSIAVDNHMIVAVQYNGEFVFLDATETYGMSGEYAYRIQGRPIMIEDGENFILTTVPESESDADRVDRDIEVRFDADEVVARYKVNEFFSGEPNKYIIYGFNSITYKNRIEALNNYLRPFETGSMNILEESGLKEEEQVKIVYECASSDGVIDLGSEYYIDIDPSTDLEYVELSKERIADWFFDERYNRETTIEFITPSSYSITYFPKSFSSKTDEFELSVHIEKSGENLLVTKTLKIYDGFVRKENKKHFEEALSKLKEYYDDRVIIAKK